MCQRPADLLKSLIESPENRLHSLTRQKVSPTNGKTQIAATPFARQMGVVLQVGLIHERRATLLKISGSSTPAIGSTRKI